MKNAFLRCAVLAPLLLLAACDDQDRPTGPATPPAANPTVTGTWTTSTLIQFRRTHDGHNGSFTCSGQMTLTQQGNTFRGFAVVNAPCPPSSFDVSGSVQPNGDVSLSAAAPRPPAGQCPAPPPLTYTGLMTMSQVSVRASANLDCPGPGEGAHRFDYILTGFKR